MAATAPRTSANGLERPAAELVLGAPVPLAVEPAVSDSVSVAVSVSDDVSVSVAVDERVGETMVVFRDMGMPVPEGPTLPTGVRVGMVELSATEADERIDETASETEELISDTDEEMADETEAEAEVAEAEAADEAAVAAVPEMPMGPE